MMRAERGEEAAMLLSAYQQAAQRDAAAVMMQRRRTIRTLFGAISAVVLFFGCIAAVDVFALNDNGADTVTLEVTTTAGDDEAIAMESQFGWNSIGYGWCSIKSSTWCMFSKDKEKCKENINCYKNRSQPSGPAGSGSGSGSGGFGNATVGDSSTGEEVEAPGAEGGEEGATDGGEGDATDGGEEDATGGSEEEGAGMGGED